MPFQMVGQKFLMGCGFLERRVVMRNSLFNRQLTGKKQALAGLSFGFRSHADICAFVLEIVAEISANSLRRETGKDQGNYKNKARKSCSIELPFSNDHKSF